MSTTTYDFYSILDILSELGGLGASIKILMSSMAFVYMMIFIWMLAQMIQRKDHLRVRIIQTKRLSYMLPNLEDSLRMKLENLKFHDDRDQLLKDVLDFIRIKVWSNQIVKLYKGQAVSSFDIDLNIIRITKSKQDKITL